MCAERVHSMDRRAIAAVGTFVIVIYLAYRTVRNDESAKQDYLLANPWATRLAKSIHVQRRQHTRPIAFIHIPKAGGLSALQYLKLACPRTTILGNVCDFKGRVVSNVQRASARGVRLTPCVGGKEGRREHTAAHQRRNFLVPGEDWSDVYSFGIVRNPFALVLSHFFWILGNVCPTRESRRELRCVRRGVGGIPINATEAERKRQFRRWAPGIKNNGWLWARHLFAERFFRLNAQLWLGSLFLSALQFHDRVSTQKKEQNSPPSASGSRSKRIQMDASLSRPYYVLKTLIRHGQDSSKTRSNATE